ncbi:MAG: M6 family metalloprotease domain-containing protein [Anaerolineaceae bacterium]|nr:M6 family metalloprotease domain-containing protein [Anaerolineaceae bacterium]
MNGSHKQIILLIAAFLALAAACLFHRPAEASPAAPVDFELTQPDGSTVFTARQWGDEWNHGIETIAGYSILQAPDGWWVYAELKADGLMAPALNGDSYRRVGIDSPGALPLHLRSTFMNENPHSPAAMSLAMPTLESTDAPTLTTLKTLILLADFTDVNSTYSAASFQSLMFSTTSSSVRKYFNEISFNNLDIVPAAETCGTSNDGITNWTDLGYAHPDPNDYPNPIGTANYDIVKNVLTANNGCIDFATFDTNSNGYIETSELVIVVVVAGGETAYSSTGAGVWGHQAWLNNATGGAPTLDGKVLGYYPYGNYAQFGEVHYDHQATIGIMAHEYGHIINWPDLYDTTPQGNFDSEGVGEWSIMGSGNWNNTSGGYAGDSPAHADAWLKWYQGWITPTTVSGTQNNVTINQAETNATAYLLRPNPNGVDWVFNSQSGLGEFFLVENRNYSGYDAGLPGCGLLIWHVDEAVISDNTANGDENHALVWLEQADGNNDLAGVTGSPTDPGNRGDTGDPYPGSSSNYFFNSGTTPNSNLYVSGSSGVSVHIDSTACSASMQADLTYTSPGPGDFSKTSPANTAIGQPTSITLDWADASGAASYDYCIDTYVDGACGSTWYSTGSTSQYSFNGSTGTTYEWQVRANDGSGGTTYANSGFFWHFTTITQPGPFPKIAPPNGMMGVGTHIILDWGDASNTLSYDYCLDTNPNGVCNDTWHSTGMASMVALTGLPSFTAYEWQVRANNGPYSTDADGGTYHTFTTGGVPNYPLYLPLILKSQAAAGSLMRLMAWDFMGLMVTEWFPGGW